jgi:hypothetical protein
MGDTEKTKTSNGKQEYAKEEEIRKQALSCCENVFSPKTSDATSTTKKNMYITEEKGKVSLSVRQNKQQ